MLWFLAHAALAVPTSPGLAAAIVRCTPEPDAACWEQAAKLEHFAPPRGLEGDLVSTDIRLAHDGARLLVRVDALPDGFEAQLAVTDNNDPWLRKAVGVRGDEGVLTVTLPKAVKKQKWLRARVELYAADTDRLVAWAPAGEVNPWDHLDGLLVDGEVEGAAIEVAIDGRSLSASATGAAEVQVQHERMPLARGRAREAGAPWSAVSKSSELTEDLPNPGWYRVTALWATDDGHPAGVTQKRIYVAPEADGLHLEGIHPAPREVRLRDGSFQTDAKTRILVESDAFRRPAELLAGDIERLTGHAPTIQVAKRPRRNSIWFGSSDRSVEPWSASPPPDVARDAFRVTVSATGIAVAAAETRAAVYASAAIADGLGLDGRLRAMAIEDWPELPRRFLAHRVDVRANHAMDPTAYADFLERMVTRGRLTTVILILRGAFAYESRPELADRHAWTQQDIDIILDRMEALGVEVFPGANAPGHADWFVRDYPELREGESGFVACTRHPLYREVLTDVYRELFQAFRQPAYMHVGHDEVSWDLKRLAGSDWCPRCSGSPAYERFTDDILWHQDMVGELGAEPIIWSDMLVKEWNGGRELVARSAEQIPPKRRAEITVMSWAEIGDSVGQLGELGYPMWWGSTGAHDARWRGLASTHEQVEAAGFALFHTAPWTAFSHFNTDEQAGTINHWGTVVLGGTNGWQPALAAIPTEDRLAALVDSPAFQPAQRGVSAGDPLPLVGDSQGHGPRIAVPESLVVSGVSFEPDLRFAGPDPVTVTVGEEVRGVALLTATHLPAADESRLRRASFKAGIGGEDGVPVARIHVAYADGSSASQDLFYGVHTWKADGSPMVRSLWRTQGTAVLSSTEDLPPGERTVTRLDWVNPHPDRAVRELVIASAWEGASVMVLAATALQ